MTMQPTNPAHYEPERVQAASVPPFALELPDFTGETLGSYRLLERIGRGGFAHVYKAEHTFLKQKVALKLLARAGRDRKALLRFYQEARLAAALSHPNISSVRDFGVDIEGRPYLVMDLEEGMTMSMLIRKMGRLLPEDVLSIARQLASAIAHAHGHGILHRDIKPANIVVNWDVPGQPHIRLIDFGAAKVELDEQTLTKTGDMFGTPEYMSPEQCAGHDADARSDIYALGCVLYETLTGDLPFKGRTDLEILHRQLHEPMPPIDRDIKAPLFLKRAIARMLEKRPDKRFQSAEQLARALGVRTAVYGLEPHLPLRAGFAVVAVVCTVFGAYIGSTFASFSPDYSSEMQKGKDEASAGNLESARKRFEAALLAALRGEQGVRLRHLDAAMQNLHEIDEQLRSRPPAPDNTPVPQMQ